MSGIGRCLWQLGGLGRRVEVRVGDREITAIALDTGELARWHTRSFARRRTITALEHARALSAAMTATERMPSRRSRPAHWPSIDQLIA